MTCYTAFGKAIDEKAAKKISLILDRMVPKPIGIGLFEIEDGFGFWEIAAYFTGKPDYVKLAILEKICNVKFCISKVETKDWVSKVNRELTPVSVGRFVIFGAHDKELIALNSLGLCIEAATAFGTGHHNSTVGCLFALEYLTNRGHKFRNVADIGCGTGILAMATALVHPQRVLACDIDTVAVQTARANFLKNGFARRIQLVRSNGFRNQNIMMRAPFDLIFANILANPLCQLAKEMYKFCKTNGIIVLSGILASQATRVTNYYYSCGFSRLLVKGIGEWTTIIFVKK